MSAIEKKMLVTELDIAVGELFPDSLDEVIDMSQNKAGSKTRVAPVIPMINKEKKVVVESSNTAT